jgi:hypothetical protein
MSDTTPRKIVDSSGNPSSGTLVINAGYLTGLADNFLQPLLDEVTTLLTSGQTDASGILLPPLSNSLSVPAGSNSFEPAADLINALGQVGGSVNSDLTWFQTALTDTIDEIHTTVASMKSTDDLNAEQVQTFMTDFSAAFSDVSQSPTGGQSSTGGSPT